MPLRVPAGLWHHSCVPTFAMVLPLQRAAVTAALAAAWLLLPAPTRANEPSLLNGTCRIRFFGTSTLHDFEGAAPATSFQVRRFPETSQWSAEINVEAARLHTANGWRDEKMRDMFSADRYPILHASFDRIDPATARPAMANGTGLLPFTLEIREIRRPIRAQVSNWRETADTVSFDAQFSVSLEEFGLTPPSALGFVRVGDSVRVDVQVEAKTAPGVDTARAESARR